MAEDAYCTLLMSDSYLPGALVLAHSLRDAGTSKKLAVLVTLDSLLPSTIAELKNVYHYVLPVNRIANPYLENLSRLDRLDLRFAFTKIAVWRQEQFRKLIYVDADVVALRAPDELFNLTDDFAAAPDIGWPDIFNSGVMVLKPDMSEFRSLRTAAASGSAFDGADQGLLNQHFAGRPWRRISFAYNCTPSPGYQYEPAFRYFRSSISMVHFIGKDKPWARGREALSATPAGVYRELLGMWWAVYDRHYTSAKTSALGQITPSAATVQQYVRGEEKQSAISWGPAEAPFNTDLSSLPPVPPTTPIHGGLSEHSALSAFKPSTPQHTESGSDEQFGSIDQRVMAPEPAPFDAPQMDWDATRSKPPVESKPEAVNLPSQRYEMSHDSGLFRPPVSYPAPPKEVESQLPSTKPAVYEKPKPIFPWEQNARIPTRVFPDDVPAPTSPASQPRDSHGSSSLPGTTSAASILSDVASATQSPSTPTMGEIPGDQWASFSRTNAWDRDSAIDSYIRALKHSQQQHRRGHIQVLHHDQPEPVIAAKDFAESPNTPQRTKRRESLILTDFPTEIERPSLPVTPAPIQRQNFWGEERDSQGNLPRAEGVPDQVDWNPSERLEELRLASVLASDKLQTALAEGKANMPQRDHPESARAAESSPNVSPSDLAQGISPTQLYGFPTSAGGEQSTRSPSESTITQSSTNFLASTQSSSSQISSRTAGSSTELYFSGLTERSAEHPNISYYDDDLSPTIRPLPPGAAETLESAQRKSRDESERVLDEYSIA